MSNKSGRSKRFRSQDKHRWRNFGAWFIPFLSASIIGVIVTHGDVRFWVVFVSAVCLMLYAWLLLERYICREKPAQHKLRAAIALACVLVIAAGGWFRLRAPTPALPPRPWLRLSEEERQRFISALASQTEPRERIRLGCPAANEEICVLVTPFVDAFKRGHFIVENDRVERVMLGKPTSGVVLFKYGHADAYDPQDPDQGVWMEVSSTLETLESAFAEIGINVRTAAEEKLPQHTAGVYFGIESHDPIERRDLKKLKQEAKEQSSEGTR